MCLIIRVFLFPCLHWRRSKKIHILIFEAFDANLVVAEAVQYRRIFTVRMPHEVCLVGAQPFKLSTQDNTLDVPVTVHFVGNAYDPIYVTLS